VKYLIAIAPVALMPVALMLAGCGESDKPGAPAQPVAAVAAPAGTSWADTVAATPDGHFLMGNPNATVKVVEYGSYTCSHCADFSKEASEEIRELVNSGKMNFEFRPYVRDPIDMTTALLARCAGKDVFYPLSEQYFANQGAMFAKAEGAQAALAGVDKAPPAQRPVMIGTALGLIDFAKQRGVAEDQAKKCLADTKVAGDLVKGVEAANDQYNITGTPSFLINGALQENTANWPTLRAKLRDAGV
jgi:protein-disulfide isomerase